MSDTETVLELINKVADGIVANKGETEFSAEKPFIIVPENYKVENMKEFAAYIDGRLPAPRRLHKRMRFVDVSSFLIYFEKFRKGHNPQLFHKVASDGMHVMGVFDYDEAGIGTEAGVSDASATQTKWGDNVSFLKLAYSRDYQMLKGLDGKWFDQVEFALFVEENQHLFIQPDGATMFELAQELKGKQNVEWQSGKRLNNSSTQFQYLEKIDAQTVSGTPLEVPDYLLLRLPMYEGMADKDIKLAFRWKLHQGHIQFAYKLLTKVAERAAEDEVKQRITGTTNLDLLTVSSFDGLTPHRLD